MFDGGERDAELHVFEDGLQSVCLLETVGKDEYAVSVVLVAQELAGQNVEVLVKYGLG